MWNSLRTRLTIILFGLAIGPLLVAGIILAQQSYATEQKVAYDLQTQVTQNVSTELETLIQSIVNELSDLGNEVRNPQTDRAQKLGLMLGAFSTGPYRDTFEELTLLDNSGQEQIRLSRQEIFNENQLVSRSGMDEFEIPKLTRTSYFSPVQVDKATGTRYITIAIPLYKPRSVLLDSVFIAKVRFNAVGNLLRRVNVGSDQTVYVTDANGNVLAHQDRTAEVQASRINLPSQPDIQSGLEGANVVLATEKIQLGEQSIFVVAEKPVTKALALATGTIRTIAIIVAATILLAAVLGFQAVRQIVKPIEELAATAESITAGDFSQQAEVQRLDEIGALGRAFNAMTAQLRELIGSLEHRVEERTMELEQANKQVQNRAEQFEAIAQISRIISSIKNQEELLRRITRMVSQYFGFYHVGIFLLDENNQYAVLRAANSQGGQKMLKRGHRLEVGQTGIVGFATATGNPRIALDTGSDAVYFDNPDLPDTRSEMALPLKTGGQVVGALDVQSIEANAFTQEDINILSALADQVSAALENARLHEDAQAALARAEVAYRQLTGKAWADIRHLAPVTAYRFDGSKAEPLKMPANGEQNEGQKEAFSVPVQLRGESIGRLRINPKTEGHQWSEDEIAIIQATADRVALAVENARLVSESQKLASKEQVIGEASSKISSAINLDNILQTALREMGRILPGAEISIQVENE